MSLREETQRIVHSDQGTSPPQTPDPWVGGRGGGHGSLVGFAASGLCGGGWRCACRAGDQRAELGAAADGKTDDTAAFQRGFDAAQTAGGGTVYAPPGRYLFQGTLSVPNGVTLRGSYGYVPNHPDIRDRRQGDRGDENRDHMVGTTPGLREVTKWVRPGEDGTALLVTGGKGNENGTPFVMLHTNRLDLWPDDLLSGADHQEPPFPFPWTIAMRGCNCAAFDMELLNPYQGINTSAPCVTTSATSRASRSAAASSSTRSSTSAASKTSTSTPRGAGTPPSRNGC